MADMMNVPITRTYDDPSSVWEQHNASGSVIVVVDSKPNFAQDLEAARVKVVSFRNSFEPPKKKREKIDYHTEPALPLKQRKKALRRRLARK